MFQEVVPVKPEQSNQVSRLTTKPPSRKTQRKKNIRGIRLKYALNYKDLGLKGD